MRLSQIARKLNVTQSEISKLLVQADMESPKGGNTKLTEEQLAQVFKKYGEIEEDQEVEEIEVAQSEVVIESVPKVVEVEVEEEEVSEVEAIKTPVPEAAEEVEEEIEVIRVKKIKLDGIKVLGKIDLPEPKVKKVEPKEEDSQVEGDKTKRPAGNQRFAKQNRRKPYKKAPLTFEQKQALEEKKREIARKEREKKQKEKKRAHYEKQVSKKKVATPKKKKTTKVDQENYANKRTKIETRNPFKKFWIWLNDPYA